MAIENFRGILGTWVYSNETNPVFPLGKVVDIVIDPLIAKGVALWIKTIDGLRLVDIRDIQTWRKNIYIPSQKEILKPTEFPRILPILEREVPIIGADVFVQEIKNFRKIGKVINFAFIKTEILITDIEVNTGWWIFGKKIKITRKRILKIDKTGIFVTNNLIQDTKVVSKKTEDGITFSSTPSPN